MCDWFHSIKFNGLIDNKDRRDWLHWLRWTAASSGNVFFNSLFIIIIRKESFYGLSIHHSLRSIIIHLTLGISVYLSIESGDVLAMMEIWSRTGIRPTSTAEYKPITLFMVLIEHKSSPNDPSRPCWLFYKPYFFPRQRRRFPEEVLISDIGPKTLLAPQLHHPSRRSLESISNGMLSAKCANSKGPRYSLMGTKCGQIQKWTGQPMKCVLIRSIPIIPWPPNSICFP